MPVDAHGGVLVSHCPAGHPPRLSELAAAAAPCTRRRADRARRSAAIARFNSAAVLNLTGRSPAHSAALGSDTNDANANIDAMC